jgi:hypothetical protein
VQEPLSNSIVSFIPWFDRDRLVWRSHAGGLFTLVLTPPPAPLVPASGPADAPSVSRLTDDLRLLETERDEAVRVGEDCARTVVKLEEMVRDGSWGGGCWGVGGRWWITRGVCATEHMR